MKTTTLKTTVAFLLTISFGVHATAKGKEHTPSKSGSTLPAGFKPKQTSAVTFTENKGQVSDQNYQPRPDVLFSGSVNEMVYHIRNNGISYQLSRVDSWKRDENTFNKITNAGKMNSPSSAFAKDETKKIPDQTTLYRLDINWLNSNSNYTVETDAATEGYNNYYLPTCPNGATHVKSYTGITLKNIYKNINLHYYQKNGALEYDYLVAPHADYHQIQLSIAGATGIEQQADGSLILKTPLGNITEGAPLVYQNSKQLQAKWVIKNNVLSFDISNCNPDLPLVIDPTVNRVWGTYYGGHEVQPRGDQGYACTTDAIGNIYMAGIISSYDNIATTGSYQSTYAGGYMDGFLAKFTSIGARLWGTYYGSNTADAFISCCTDLFGNVYASGRCMVLPYLGDSTLTMHGHQNTYGGGLGDALLVKFDASGVRLWDTYYGGISIESGYSCATDTKGNVYMTGTLEYTGVLVTGGDTIAQDGYQNTPGGGSIDLFLVKFNATGVRLWATYYGACSNEGSPHCSTDPKGNVFLSANIAPRSLGWDTIGHEIFLPAGDTIVTPGSHQSIYGGGYQDAFLVKFDSTGHRLWATYYGGSGEDSPTACATDANGNVYMTGYTYSTDSADFSYIAEAGHRNTSVAMLGAPDAFLVKLNPEGNRLWGTYYGGISAYAVDCATDKELNVYMTGGGYGQDDTIITVGGWSLGWLEHAPYLAKFDSIGTRKWSTPYGSKRLDLAGSPMLSFSACTTDQFGNIYATGMCSTFVCGDSIATPDSHQPLGVGELDAFLVKFSDCDLAVPIISYVSDTLYSSSGATYKWYKDGILIPGASNQSYIPTENGSYTVCITAHGEVCEVCSESFDLTTGINEHRLDNAISIYPNPNNGQYEISLQLNTQDNYTLELTNALGQVLYHEELKNFVGSYHKQLDETNYGAGIYLFRVKNSKEQSVKKVISW